jgi:tRNA-splicing ligase RtcB
MINLESFKQLSDYEWEIPQSFRWDMRVPVRIFATKQLLEAALGDLSIEQAINAATLPGLVGSVLVMPDMHQGYGFPIGGVAATKYPEGVISPGAIGYDINCLSGDSLILHEHGFTRKIQDFAEEWRNAELICFDVAGQKLDKAKPINWFGQKPKSPPLRITTQQGHTLIATRDHPLWTLDGMIPCGRLQVGTEVAVSPFAGIPYERPIDETLISEADFESFLVSLGKTTNGNSIGQIRNALRKRGLLPLSYSADSSPYLCKILGFIFGDGNIHFDRKTNKGMVAFYGQAEDLEDIRSDIARLGFKPSRVWSRERTHRIRTVYDDYAFERTEHWVTVNSSAFAALLAFLGAPIGKKTIQKYPVPAWIAKTPLWQKRLFLAALFGAEMTTPQTISGHATTLAAPTLSMNKSESYEADGRAFLNQIAAMLKEFGITTQPIGIRREQVNADGRQSIRLRLSIKTEPDNLIRLWGTVSFEYNRKRKAMAAIAAHYMGVKKQLIGQRQAVADQAIALKEAGVSKASIVEQLTSNSANERFIERALYESRDSAPRVHAGFIGFQDFARLALDDFGESGFVWDKIASIETIPFDDLVYDFTMDHLDHNFVADGLLVSNCGVRLLASSIPYEANVDRIDALASALNEFCPSGIGSKGAIKLSAAELDQVCREGSRWTLKHGFATDQDLRRTEESGRIEGADPSTVSARAKERGRSQLGTLGAGNHFIEVDVVDRIFAEDAAQVMGLIEGCLVVQIHCGSRGFGHQICTDYVHDFQEAVHRYGIVLPDRELVCAPIDSPEGRDYLSAMKCAANFAFANRQALAHAARQAFESIFAHKVHNWQLQQVYDIAHNMGKIETHTIEGERLKVCVHRKGATRAFGPGSPELPSEYQAIGQPVLIPGSMGTASWVLTGTDQSMLRSFGSTCHGAGRVMSRHQAKREVRGEKLRDELEERGIHVRAGSLPGLAEEAPQAYKDVDAVIETVVGAGIARKVARLRPVAVIKG